MRRDQRTRWRGHPVLGGVLAVLVYVVPAAAGIAAGVLTGRLVPRPSGVRQILLWWAPVLAVSMGAVLLTERLARRLLPLAALLKASMLFPDRAPSRFMVARRAGNVRGLQTRVDEARRHGLDDEPTRAAETILTLVAALSTHDRRTRGHAERVRVFTDLLSEEMKFRPADRDRLRWAAILHDIGKLAVPSTILNKPGRPDDDEWKVLQRHPDEGARLVAPLLPWLGQWAGAIKEHHERHDGGGYPRGLRGSGISLGARIVAVADAFETMTAARAYKRPMSPAAAREELARCAGTHFDPAVVRAFLQVSLGRLRWTVGPASWLAQLPFLYWFGGLSHQAAVIATAAVTAVPVVASGFVAAPAAVGAASPPAEAQPSANPNAWAGWAQYRTPATPVPVVTATPRPSAAPVESTSQGVVTAAPTPEPPVPYFLGGGANDKSRPPFPLLSASPAPGPLPDYYDKEHNPGLVVEPSPSNVPQNDPQKFPSWTLPVSSPLTISGSASLVFFSAMDQFQAGKRGSVLAFLQDCAGKKCVLVATGALVEPNWSGGSATWVQKTLTFPAVTYTVPAGHTLTLALAVHKDAEGKMRFAFGTADFPSALTLG